MPAIAKNLPGLFRGMLCILLHLCFGTVYAWSFFQVLLVDFVGWSYADTSLSFGITIFTLGISAAWAGIMLPKIGPRKLALAGSTLFSLGYVIAAWALHTENLLLFWLGYGFVGGTGLGFGYVVPVATIANWFPGSKGLSTGLVVMGFGLGAMFLSVILAPILLTVTKQDLTSTFLYLGVFFACVLIPASFFVTNPKSTTAAASQHVASIEEQQDHYVRRCLQSREFIVMWLIFFFNIAAGISVISFQSPLLQD
ncbi:MAG: MFS transporter, partial [Gammaproteobacteria bacterium]|nr:MFS transporter [Gammaproteobacteria bacterium]